MFRIFERIPTPETLREETQEKTRRLQAKKEKKLCRQQEADQFNKQRQLVNEAIFNQENRRM